MGRRYLVTGGAGFIGSNFIRYVLEHEPDSHVTNLDAMTYAGVQATVDELNENRNHTFVRGDIRDPQLVDEVMPGHDVVVHFAAESHVDRSIESPMVFFETNVVGTAILLEAARRHGISRFVHVSTDEVYGSVTEGEASETRRLNPSSPYSSSKAASDLLVLSYWITYGYNTIVTRCTNNYGPYQFPEKVIPLFLTNLFEGENIPVYGDGSNERDWLYVEDHCSALHLLVDAGQAGEIYNVGSGIQTSNRELTHLILDATGEHASRIDYVEDRLGHDFRYAVDTSKLHALGWEPQHGLSDGIIETADWYRRHDRWWRPLRESP